MADNRIYNFSAGPSMLPVPVLERCASEMLNYKGSGMSVMEMSHRSKVYDGIITETEAALRRVLSIPDNYKVLFLQGGASTQFAAIPMDRQGRLCPHRQLRKQRLQGSGQVRRHPCCLLLQGPQLRPRSDAGRAGHPSGCGLLLHLRQQHHLRHRVPVRPRDSGRRTARCGYVLEHPLQAGRRLQVRRHLRRRAEEHGPGGRYRRHRP